MNPFSLFLVLALVGAVLVVGAVAINDCRNAEVVTLAGRVVDKSVVVREKTVTTTVPAGCPACPGTGTTTVTTVVPEETFYVTIELFEGGEVRTERVEVSASLFHKLKAGDTVSYRYLRGKASGRTCSRPEILVPAS